MEEKEKKKFQGEELDTDNDLNQVSGGFAGRDKFSIKEYNKYGVTHVPRTFKKDEYYYKGNQITQKEASMIVDVEKLKGK